MSPLTVEHDAYVQANVGLVRKLKRELYVTPIGMEYFDTFSPGCCGVCIQLAVSSVHPKYLSLLLGDDTYLYRYSIEQDKWLYVEKICWKEQL